MIGIPKNLYVQIFKPFKHFFHVQIDIFFSFFVRGSSVNSQKFHILLILSGKNALKWLEWCIFRVQGVPNPMAQVSSLYDKWFLKNQNFWGKNFTFCWFWLGKMHQNGLSGTYLGFEACTKSNGTGFEVSMISGSWKIKISGKTFTFCWF